jgi:predicted amino acid dehydrogenase
MTKSCAIRRNKGTNYGIGALGHYVKELPNAVTVRAPEVPDTTVNTSVVANVIPRVNETVELAGIEASYTTALLVAAAAPAIRACTRTVDAEVVVLVTTRVETIYVVDDGTVNISEDVAGAACPNI